MRRAANNRRARYKCARLFCVYFAILINSDLVGLCYLRCQFDCCKRIKIFVFCF